MSTTTTGDANGPNGGEQRNIDLYVRATRELWLFWALAAYFGFLTLIALQANVMFVVWLFFGLLGAGSLVIGGRKLLNRVAEYRVQ